MITPRPSRAIRTIATLATVLVFAGFGCAKQEVPAGPGPGGSAGTGGAMGVRGALTQPPARPVGEPSRDVPVLEASERAALTGAVTVEDQGSAVAAPVSTGDEDAVQGELVSSYALADVGGGYGIGWVSIHRNAGKTVVSGTFALEAPGDGKVYVAKLVKRGAAPEVLKLGAVAYDAAKKSGSISYAPATDISGYEAFVVTLENADGSGGTVILEGLRSTDF